MLRPGGHRVTGYAGLLRAHAVLVVLAPAVTASLFVAGLHGALSFGEAPYSLQHIDGYAGSACRGRAVANWLAPVRERQLRPRINEIASYALWAAFLLPRLLHEYLFALFLHTSFQSAMCRLLNVAWLGLVCGGLLGALAMEYERYSQDLGTGNRLFRQTSALLLAGGGLRLLACCLMFGAQAVHRRTLLTLGAASGTALGALVGMAVLRDQHFASCQSYALTWSAGLEFVLALAVVWWLWLDASLLAGSTVTHHDSSHNPKSE